ncbi:hypothetical protein [Mucilaginibacter sp. 3215]|uniref:hypothetical protein n=1 Tax=Mucilaginibacter sp. 3215 TaxID=3373912 RepID=UPI003D1C96B9
MQLDKSSSYKIKIEYVRYELLKNIALKNLGIKNLNQLRDRFEGQVYFNNFLVRSYGEIALEKLLGTTNINAVRKANEKNYIPAFSLNGKKISLITFQFGELPRILNSNFDFAVFIAVNIGNRTCEILGFINQEKLIQLIDRKSLSPLDEKNYLGVFKTFDELCPINDLSLC